MGYPLRKSAPGPPNSADEDVSCTAPPTENASLQILFKCPTPAAIVFGNARKPSRFAHFWQDPQSLAPATQNDIWTSKSGAKMWCLYILTSECVSRHNSVHFFDISTSKSGLNLVCFVHFDFEMCFAPQQRTLFRHLNFQKWSEPGVLYILTSTCVSRHNVVHFFDISTSKSGLNLVCFIHFDLEMCFAPQRRAIFIAHLASWLRTRRFSKPTFRPSGVRSHKSSEKHSVSRLSYLFAHLHLLSSDSFSSLISLFHSSLLSGSFHLCFSCVGSLTSKLPSVIYYIYNIICTYETINLICDTVILFAFSPMFLSCISRIAGGNQPAGLWRMFNPKPSIQSFGFNLGAVCSSCSKPWTHISPVPQESKDAKRPHPVMIFRTPFQVSYNMKLGWMQVNNIDRAFLGQVGLDIYIYKLIYIYIYIYYYWYIYIYILWFNIPLV